MTASTFVATPTEQFEGGDRIRPAAAPNLVRSWTSSFLIYFYPNRVRAMWLRVSMLRAIGVAAVNGVIGVLWLALVMASMYAFDQQILRERRSVIENYVPHPVQAFLDIFRTAPKELHDTFRQLPMIFYISGSVTVVLLVATGLGILFFVLLPFAARPGRNRACVVHVARAVLLSTGWVHIWGPLVTGLYLYFISHRYVPGLENIIGPLATLALVLSLWMLVSLVIAVRADYRGANDMPKGHDPWCERCGYNLTGVELEKRCPECGKPILESLSPETRPPTPWEMRPSLANAGTIREQITRIIRDPRGLFFSMPTLTGQRAAQRWLIGSVTVVGLCASLIPAAYNFLFLPSNDRNWSWDFFVGSFFVGFVWAMLALMMVGIETAGIATFSRMRAKKEPDFGGPGGREGVYLGTSAKVTAYSSILMVPWVFLGGAQLLASQYWTIYHLSRHWHVSWRMEQLLLAGSLSIAHIGGLLWYELTVYRGIRGIQYANK